MYRYGLDGYSYSQGWAKNNAALLQKIISNRSITLEIRSANDHTKKGSVTIPVGDCPIYRFPDVPFLSGFNNLRDKALNGIVVHNKDPYTDEWVYSIVCRSNIDAKFESLDYKFDPYGAAEFCEKKSGFITDNTPFAGIVLGMSIGAPFSLLLQPNYTPNILSEAKDQESHPLFQSLINYSETVTGQDDIDKINKIYEKLIQTIKDNQPGAYNYSMKQSLDAREGVCAHKAAILGIMLSHAGFYVYNVWSANVNMSHVWVRVETSQGIFDLDPEVYKTFVLLQPRIVGESQMVTLKQSSTTPKNNTLERVSFSEPETTFPPRVQGKYCSELGVCSNFNGTAQIWKDSDFFWVTSDVGANEYDFIFVPDTDLNNTGADVAFSSLMFGNNINFYPVYDESEERNYLVGVTSAGDKKMIIMITSDFSLTQQEVIPKLSQISYGDESNYSVEQYVNGVYSGLVPGVGNVLYPPEEPNLFGDGKCDPGEDHYSSPNDCKLNLTCDYGYIMGKYICVKANEKGNGVFEPQNDEACDDGYESENCTLDGQIKNKYTDSFEISDTNLDSLIRKAIKQIANKIEEKRSDMMSQSDLVIDAEFNSFTYKITYSDSNTVTAKFDYSFNTFGAYFCDENWGCTQWSTCSNLNQTRSCTDNSQCVNPRNAPQTTQSCFISCIDSDNGFSPFTKSSTTNGTMRDVTSPTGFTDISGEETCFDSTHVLESYCVYDAAQKTNLIAQRQQLCLNGCSEGECNYLELCVPLPAGTTRCSFDGEAIWSQTCTRSKWVNTTKCLDNNCINGSCIPTQ